MRFNAKKDQEQSDEHSSAITSFDRFPSNDSLSPSAQNLSDYVKNNKGQLTPIDILNVDTHSRLTLTKKFKKIFPIEPSNKVMIYQDNFSKSLVLEVQSDFNGINKSISTYIVTKIKGKTSTSQSFNASMQTRADVWKDKEENNKEKNIINNNDLRHKNTLSNIPILLVEDDKDILQSYILLLKLEGYNNIKTFSDSREALIHVVDPKFSRFYRLVITDIRMPGINGMNLYRILKILNPSIMAIFATGLDAAEEMMSVYPEINHKDIIGKPASKDMFVKTVNKKISNITIDW